MSECQCRDFLCWWLPGTANAANMARMERPKGLEDFRFVGDKRTQVVYDLDGCDAVDAVENLVAAQVFTTFGPDSLAEARNRGYRLCRCCKGGG